VSGASLASGCATLPAAGFSGFAGVEAADDFFALPAGFSCGVSRAGVFFISREAFNGGAEGGEVGCV